MSNIMDTIMNIEVFAFIGLMLWLYFRPSHLEKSQLDQTRNRADDR